MPTYEATEATASAKICSLRRNLNCSGGEKLLFTLKQFITQYFSQFCLGKNKILAICIRACLLFPFRHLSFGDRSDLNTLVTSTRIGRILQVVCTCAVSAHWLLAQLRRFGLTRPMAVRLRTQHVESAYCTIQILCSLCLVSLLICCPLLLVCCF